MGYQIGDTSTNYSRWGRFVDYLKDNYNLNISDIITVENCNMGYPLYKYISYENLKEHLFDTGIVQSLPDDFSTIKSQLNKYYEQESEIELE